MKKINLEHVFIASTIGYLIATYQCKNKLNTQPTTIPLPPGTIINGTRVGCCGKDY
jgi:hypothetical protein